MFGGVWGNQMMGRVRAVVVPYIAPSFASKGAHVPCPLAASSPLPPSLSSTVHLPNLETFCLPPPAFGGNLS